MAASRLCSIPGCGKPYCARGFCNAHYLRWKKNGEFSSFATDKIFRDEVCTIEGCDKPHEALGWCGMHYRRYQRNGDPMNAGSGTPRGEPGRYYRDVALPYDGDECLIWPFNRVGKGYAVMWDGQKQEYVHRLLCEAVHGPAPSPEHEVAHSCGRGFDGCVNKRHLSWKTHPENEADKIKHGTRRSGERCNFAKLNEQQVREILLLQGRMYQREIAKKFGVSQTLISQIHRRTIWTCIS